MARAEDVVVSNRLWRWTSAPNGVSAPRPDPLVIVDVSGLTVRYKYVGDGQGILWGRTVGDFLAHAEPDPLPAPSKCAPGCTPAHPCWTPDACPVFNEPTARVMTGFNTMYGVAEVTRRRCETPESIELRCGRELACGLFRVT